MPGISNVGPKENFPIMNISAGYNSCIAPLSPASRGDTRKDARVSVRSVGTRKRGEGSVGVDVDVEEGGFERVWVRHRDNSRRTKA